MKEAVHSEDGAQEDGMMDRAFFDNYLGAWNTHDSAAVARYMADDAIYEEPATITRMNG
ncbi:MAG: hypothetical protein ABW318_04280 [Vicinamibacterales bacterium]